MNENITEVKWTIDWNILIGQGKKKWKNNFFFQMNQTADCELNQNADVNWNEEEMERKKEKSNYDWNEKKKNTVFILRINYI